MPSSIVSRLGRAQHLRIDNGLPKRGRLNLRRVHMYLRLRRQMWPHLRILTQAGGRLAAERVRDYALWCREQGIRFYVMYGQTEATARIKPRK